MVKDDRGLGIPHSSSCSQELHSVQANNGRHPNPEGVGTNLQEAVT